MQDWIVRLKMSWCYEFFEVPLSVKLFQYFKCSQVSDIATAERVIEVPVPPKALCIVTVTGSVEN